MPATEQSFDSHDGELERLRQQVAHLERDLAQSRIRNEELRRQAQMANEHARLYHELRQFRTTLDQTLDCVFMFDPQTLRFFYVNQGAVDQVGYSAEELHRMTPLDIKPEFSEETFRAMLAPLISGERSRFTFETIHRHKDGHDIPVEVALQYVAPDEDGHRFVAIVRDITERRHSQAALAEQARLIDMAHEAIIVRDLEGRISLWNRGAEDLYGWPADEVIGQVTHKLFQTRPVDPTTIEAQQQQLLKNGLWEGELLHRRSDGRMIIVESNQAAVLDREGALLQILEINRDISERKRHEADLRERTAQLARATATLAERNRELDQFAYITSHDLKAPLRGIANLSQWIEEDLGDRITPEIQNHLELLRGRVNRMEKLISGILHYSRVGRTRGSLEDVEIGELLAEIIDLIAPPERVTINLPASLPTIHTERVLLHQVFANLIGNAIKHHSGGEIIITIGWSQDKQRHTFVVSDNGPGIAPQYHDRIFGIFQTLAPRDVVEGSGLGLALVKKIVEHQGGRIWIESQEGAGATFYFTWSAVEA